MVRYDCVCVHIFMYMHMCVYVCEYVEAWGQLWMLFLRSHPPHFWARVTHLAWSLPNRWGWLASEPQMSNCLCLLSAWIIPITKDPWHFCVRGFANRLPVVPSLQPKMLSWRDTMQITFTLCGHFVLNP